MPAAQFWSGREARNAIDPNIDKLTGRGTTQTDRERGEKFCLIDRDESIQRVINGPDSVNLGVKANTTVATSLIFKLRVCSEDAVSSNNRILYVKKFHAKKIIMDNIYLTGQSRTGNEIGQKWPHLCPLIVHTYVGKSMRKRSWPAQGL